MAERKGIMLCYTFNERRFHRYNKPVVVQPKLNGNRCRALIDQQSKVTLLSSSEKVIVSVPHINKQLEAWEMRNVELDGELYLHGLDHQYINSIVSPTVNIHPEHEILEYWVFDVIQPGIGQLLRTRKLASMELFPCVTVESRLAHDLMELEELYNEFLNQGFEGIIIRDPKAEYQRKKTTMMMKLKPRLKGTYPVIATVEEISIEGHPKNALGALILMKDDELFNVGTGFSRLQRERYWQTKDELVGKMCKIKYQELSAERKVPKMTSFNGFVE